jgi:hypothetical protein
MDRTQSSAFTHRTLPSRRHAHSPIVPTSSYARDTQHASVMLPPPPAFPAAADQVRRRRTPAQLRLAALYRLLPVDLIHAVLITRAQPGNPSSALMVLAAAGLGGYRRVSVWLRHWPLLQKLPPRRRPALIHSPVANPSLLRLGRRHGARVPAPPAISPWRTGPLL